MINLKSTDNIDSEPAYGDLSGSLMTNIHQPESPRKILIVDPKVLDYQRLIKGTIIPVDRAILNLERDGVLQIADILHQYDAIAEIHIVCHGSPGCLKLGNTQLNSATLPKYSDRLQTLTKKLSNASIILYGCQVAAKNTGKAFISQLKQLTGANNITASTTTTGNQTLGGNWNLEVSQGQPSLISSLFSEAVMAAYSHILAFDSDDFNSSNLDSRWTFVDPNANGSYSLTGTGTADAYLQLSVPGNRDMWRTNRSAVRMMQPALNEDMGLEVKFATDPHLDKQMQGILVEQDNKNWLRFDIFKNGSGFSLFSVATSNGSSQVKINQSVNEGEAQYLRVNREGNQWSLEYSGDGDTWNSAGSFTHNLTVNEVGVFAGNAGGSSPDFTSQVDYFFNTTAPIVPEDGQVIIPEDEQPVIPDDDNPDDPVENQPPIANDDTATVRTGNTVTVNVLNNDSDPDGVLISDTVTIVDSPDYGTITVNPNGTITYSHDGSSTTTDSFTYTVADDDGAISNPATVSLSIQENQPPTANNDTATVKTGNAVTVNVLANDSDPDGTLIADTVAVINQPDYGTITVNPNGTITYSHDGSSTTTDSFTYTVADDDGATSNEATVSLSIQENQPPIANDDTATVMMGESIAIGVLNNDSDPDGSLDPGTLTLVETPTSGSFTINNGVITYTHDGSDTTPDSFTYTVQDNQGAISNVANVTINVQQPSDDPNPTVIDLWYGSQPSFGQIGLPQIWANVLGHVSDPDGISSLSYSLNGGAEIPLSVNANGKPRNPRLEKHGDFNIDLAFADLDPSPNDDVVLIKAVDGLGNVSTETVTIDYESGNIWPENYSIDWTNVGEISDVAQIVDGLWSVSDAGVRTVQRGYDRLIAIGDMAWDDYEVTVPVTIHRENSNGIIGLLLRWQGHQPDSAQPHVEWRTHGSIGSYNPKEGLELGGQTTVDNSSGKTLSEGKTYVFKMRAETVDNGSNYSLKVWEENQPEPAEWDMQSFQNESNSRALSNGSLLLVAHHYDATFGNITTFPLGSDRPNQTPTANNDTATVRTGNTVTVNVLNNDSDPDGTLIADTVAVINQPDYGTITVNPNGTITYSHDGSSTTTDSFTYTVADNDSATSNEATVSLSIQENQTPTANDDTATVRTGNTVTVNVLNNDSDPDGVLISDTVAVINQPDYGTITVNPNGTITYSHDGSSTTTDSFTYTVADNDGATSNEAVVSLSIQENQTPTANDDTATVRTGNTVTVNVLNNDSDPDGTLIADTVAVINQPDYGTITVNPNGTITYSHDGSSTTTDSFTYTVADNDGATSNEAIVSLSIQENQTPTANDDTATVMMGESIAIGVLNNDSDPDGSLDPDTLTIVETPTSGSFTINNGVITYTHDGSDTNPDSFTYTVQDNQGAISNVATVSISVSDSDSDSDSDLVLAFESDDFNSSNLDSRWTFVDPKANGSYSLTGTGTTDAYLQLSVPGNRDMWRTNRSAVRMMQPALNEDMGLEVKFATDPHLDKQMQGILVEQDNKNWLRFDIFKNGSGFSLFSVATSNGSSQVKINQSVNEGEAQYLRVNREGNQWSLEYSGDGDTWNSAGSFTHNLTVNEVGVFAGNAGGSSPDFTSQVDYFFNTTAPIVPEDTPDLIAPTAELLDPNLTPILGSNQGYSFTVSYSDDLDMDGASLDDGDIRVTGPNGFDQLATLVRVYGEENKTAKNATYKIMTPGGTWDAGDSGSYTVSIEPNAVSDTGGNFIPATSLGSFTIDFSDNTSTQNIVFPADAGVVDVRDYGAIPNDGIDDTAAIQQALNDNGGQNRIIYFPNGIYDVSGQIAYPGSQKRNILQGESRDRTIIRLQDNLGFDNAVIDTGNPPAQRFRNSIRDLTVDVGEGNPDAIAINFMANNQGTLNNVRMVSRDGQGAIGLNLATDENGPLLVKDVEVVGFDVGIRTLNPTASQTLEGIKLVNQNVYGWQNFNQTVFVRDLESTNAVPVIWNQPDGSSDFTIIDANLTGVGAAATQPAIHNQKAMYVNNLHTSGYELAILQDDKGRGNLSQPDGHVAEWMARGGFNTLFDAPSKAFDLEVLPTPVIPWDDLSDWVSPLGFDGVPNDGVDDTAAIQAAIDSGASTVYLPNGLWNINGNLQLRNNLQRFIGTEAKVVGGGTITLADGTGAVVSVERLEAGSISFVQDSDRTMVMSNLIIDEYFNTSQGTGDLYIEDVSGGPWSFNNQNVWARQINPETIDSPRIKNDGGNLWILGYKTEDEGTLIETINGGKTEVFGAYILNGEFGDIPVFINNESSLSYIAGSFLSFKGEPLPGVGVEEIQNLETRRTIGFPGYYSSTSLNPVPVNNIVGTEGDDWLNGTEPNSSTPGREQIDILTGNGGFDTFVLGDSNFVYYDDGIDNQPGWQDYALITDFNNDVIQLHGSSEDYRLIDSPEGLPTGLAIFHKGDITDELIGIVQGMTNISLDSPSFVYV